MSIIGKMKRFEAHADAAVAAMPIAGLPARALLAGLRFFLYSAHNAALFGRAAQSGAAETTATRMSYVLPLLERCPAVAPLGSALEALDASSMPIPSETNSHSC